MSLKDLLWGLVILTIPAGAAAQPERAEFASDGADCSSLETVDWMAGVWETAGGSTIFREAWTRVSESTWEGRGEMLSAATRQVGSTEALRLVAMGSGVFYIAKVDHNALPTAFELTDCSIGTAVFENPDHDFPKRIAYRRVGPDHIDVRVDDGAGEGFTLEFGRASE